MKHLKKISIIFFLLISCALLQASFIFPGSTKSITFTAVGDIMCHTRQLHSAYNKKCNCYSFHSVFHEIKPVISQADVAIGNLETTLPGKRELYAGFPCFGAPDALVNGLKKAGFDVLNTANNHCMDRGPEVIKRTIAVLRKKGLYQPGTYISIEDFEKRRVLIVKKKGLRTAILSYTFGVNGIPVPDTMKVNLIQKKQIIDDLKIAHQRRADIIIVLFHFGTEYKMYPNEKQKNLAKLSFLHGADVIMGCHPHVIQPFDIQRVTDIYGVTKKRLVAYSLGNFIADQRSPNTDGGLIFHFSFQRNNRTSPALLNGLYCEPVWIFRNRKNKKNVFKALPTSLFLKNDRSFQLTKNEHRQLTTFHNSILDHLHSSIGKAQKEGLWKKFNSELK